MIRRRTFTALLAGTVLLAGAGLARAAEDINIGVFASLTGPAAALGVEVKRAVALMPTEIDGHKINFIVLDDATDPTVAVKTAQRFVSEYKIDAAMGPEVNALAAAVVPVMQDSGTPLIVLAPYIPPADRAKWVFRSVQNAGTMVSRIVADMKERGVKTAAYIGFGDAWGDLLWKEFEADAKEAGIQIVAEERYARLDTSVTAQILKLQSKRPDAIFIGASGTPATLPQIELAKRGFKGPIYQSHGASTRDFLRVGGKSVEGTFIPTGPVLVAEQLPDDHPSKAAGVAFNSAYEAAYGPKSRSTLAGTAWDGWLLLKAALPVALKAGAPGTPEFRTALRDALENTKDLVGVHGVYTMTAEDHTGLDDRARVLITVKDGDWVLVK
ncbi:ABC transporter substrate-binding protein [Segnochrobactraceae bacterium EtOH-i3]